MGVAVEVKEEWWVTKFAAWLKDCIAKLKKKPAEGEEQRSPELVSAGLSAAVTEIEGLSLPVLPSAAKIRAVNYQSRGDDEAIQMTIAQVIAETASLGQLDFTLQGWWNIPGTRALMQTAAECHSAPFEYSIKPLLQRYWQSQNTPFLTDPRTLSNLAAQSLITQDTYLAYMKDHGFSVGQAILQRYAANRWPDVGTLLDLKRRGFITGPWLHGCLLRNGFIGEIADALIQLEKQLPGYQDIISVYMREGYLAEKWVEIPTEFMGYMNQLGYSEDWAKRLWGKHWVLPGVNLLYDMYHKGIIDRKTMALMLRYHDFEPVWRQRLIDNAYNMIPRVDLRRAYMYGSLSAAEITQRYKWLGYKPADAEIMGDIAQRFSLQRYYTRLETVARSAFRKGQLDEAGLKGILSKINIPAEAVELVLEAEKLARGAQVLELAEEPRTLTVSQVLRLYQLQVRARTWVQTRLEGQGFSSEDAALLIQLYEPRIDAVEINRDLITASSMLYREGLMKPEEYEGRLRKAGLSELEIQDKKEAEDLRYRLDYARDLITLAKEAYRKDVYTLEEFEAYLMYYGMRRERALALGALEQLRKVPKPKVSA